MKIGNRVTVIELPDDHPLKNREGKVGEVVEIDDDGNCLVDDQIVMGKAVGSCTMREWFKPDELEVG